VAGVKSANIVPFYYNTDVTDAQWKLLKKELPTPSKMGRLSTDRRIVVNAIFYVLKGGFDGVCFLHTFPLGRRSTISSVSGTAITLWNDSMVCCETRLGHEQTIDGSPRPPFLTVKVSSRTLMGDVGYDAGIRIKGRECHILIDTLGLLLGVAMTLATSRCFPGDGLSKGLLVG
jgi:putative transposase